MHPEGTENLDPRPPFRIRLPRTLKGNSRALPGNKNLASESMQVVNVDASTEKDRLIVEAYTPPDPGPYPQDQPRQNSVRFTPTQVLGYSFMASLPFPFFCCNFILLIFFLFEEVSMIVYLIAFEKVAIIYGTYVLYLFFGQMFGLLMYTVCLTD